MAYEEVNKFCDLMLQDKNAGTMQNCFYSILIQKLQAENNVICENTMSSFYKILKMFILPVRKPNSHDISIQTEINQDLSIIRCGSVNTNF